MVILSAMVRRFSVSQMQDFKNCILINSIFHPWCTNFENSEKCPALQYDFVVSGPVSPSQFQDPYPHLQRSVCHGGLAAGLYAPRLPVTGRVSPVIIAKDPSICKMSSLSQVRHHPEKDRDLSKEAGEKEETQSGEEAQYWGKYSPSCRGSFRASFSLLHNSRFTFNFQVQQMIQEIWNGFIFG